MRRFLLAVPCVLALLLPAFSADARVGEPRAQIESRLLPMRIGIAYPDEKIGGKIRGSLYRKAGDLWSEFSELPEVVIYWKSHKESNRATTRDIKDSNQPPGWDYHVVYVRGSSVMEQYQRNGARINEFELKAILMLNQGQSFWKEVPQEEQDETLLGYNYELDDGSMRALFRGDKLLIYRPKFDAALRIVDEENRSENREEQLESFRESVRGF